MTYRPLNGARDLARVIDSRVRWRLKFAVPQPQGPWSRRVPQMADPDVSQFMTELAAAMDARQRRIGEHVAQTAPPWAIEALGEVPADSVKQTDWKRRAGVLGAYREMFGHDHPREAIGPEPPRTTPEARAAWHTAFAALTHVDGIDVCGPQLLTLTPVLAGFLQPGEVHVHAPVRQRLIHGAPSRECSSTRAEPARCARNRPSKMYSPPNTHHKGGGVPPAPACNGSNSCRATPDENPPSSFLPRPDRGPHPRQKRTPPGHPSKTLLPIPTDR